MTAAIIRAVRAGRDITRTEALELVEELEEARRVSEERRISAVDSRRLCERWATAALKLIEREEP